MGIIDLLLGIAFNYIYIFHRVVLVMVGDRGLNGGGLVVEIYKCINRTGKMRVGLRKMFLYMYCLLQVLPWSSLKFGLSAPNYRIVFCRMAQQIPCALFLIIKFT